MWGRGTTIGGRYRLTERVGVGGMGEVWRGEDEVLKRQVAVKIMQPGLLEDGSFTERFRREARILATLNHPGIVHVHDYGEPTEGAEGEQIAYIVMEFIDGKPLNSVLAAEGPMVPARALGIMADALDALHVAHQQEIVHRDLKPSNLMLRSDGGVTVTDFGIAHAMAGTKITTSNSVLGTALYIAPEQADGRASTPHSDLYSLGVVCFELLTGRLPFTGETVLEIVLKHIRQPAPLLADAFPEAVRDFVATALAKDPADRFTDAAAMAASARAAAARPGAGEPVREPTLLVTVPAPPLPQPETPRTAPAAPVRQRRRTRLLVPIVIPVVIAAGVGSALLVQQAPWESRADGGSSPRTVVSASPGSGTPTAAVSGTGTPAASGPPSSSAAPSAPAGSPTEPGQQPGNPANPAPGQVGSGSGSGSGGRSGGTVSGGGNGGNGGTGSGTGASGGGGTGTGGGGGGGGGTQRSPQPPVSTPGNPPASAPASNPPAQSGPPQGCGGDGWGYITGVGSGQRLGLGSGGLAGGTPAVVGRNTSYGWLRSAPDPGGWYTVHPCNMSSPLLVQSMNDKTVGLYPDWSSMTSWKVETAPTRGAVYLADYMGSTCLTDNGAGNTATMETCTPGNSAQEWYIP